MRSYKKIFFGLGIAFFLMLLFFLFCFLPKKSDYPQKVCVTVNGYEYSNRAVMIDSEGEVFLSVPWAKGVLGIPFFWDLPEKTVVSTSTQDVQYISAENFSTQLIWTHDEPYLALPLLQSFYGGKIVWFPETQNLYVEREGYTFFSGSLLSSSGLFNSPNLKSPVIHRLQKNTSVRILLLKENWLKILEENGSVGWIPVSKMKTVQSPTFSGIPTSDDFRTNHLLNPDHKIVMTWQFVYQGALAIHELHVVDALDVISPTWFTLSEEVGQIETNEQTDYMEWAHTNDYQVWVHFTNRFNPVLTHHVLTSTSARKSIIEQLIQKTRMLGAEGIDLDWENIYLEDKHLFTQFLRELYPVMKKNGFVLSVDITTISDSENWSLCYDRPEIQKVTDFIVLMAYDQYWAEGNKSGSVAEYPWVERGVQDLLDQGVPSWKIILGVPFYSRLWIETSKEGQTQYDSESYFMGHSIQLAQDHNATWDDQISQYYAEWMLEGKRYRLWLENITSIEKKLGLLFRYNLKGAAFWRKGYEIPEAWVKITDIIHTEE